MSMGSEISEMTASMDFEDRKLDLEPLPEPEEREEPKEAKLDDVPDNPEIEIVPDPEPEQVEEPETESKSEPENEENTDDPEPVEQPEHEAESDADSKEDGQKSDTPLETTEVAVLADDDQKSDKEDDNAISEET